MDETSGSTMFDSVGQNNGTPHSVTLGRAGFSGLAYGFNGSTSYVSVPSAASMNPGSANFSFTIHLQTTGTPPPPPEDWDLIRKGDFPTPGGEYKMEYQQSGQASCGFKGSAHYGEIIAGPALNDGQWHTITCVKTSSDIELIVDGQVYSQAANIGSIANTDPVIIGSHPGADWYQGSLDEASIRIQAGNVSLTADFTASPTSGTAPLAVSFTDVSTGGPTSWSWNFGDGNTSTQQNPTHTYSTAGTYSVSLTVSNATGSATAGKTNYIVVTVPPPDFTITASPSSVAVVAGGTARYTVTLAATNGFSGAVNLSVSGLPSGSTGSFSVNPVNLPASTSSTLTITTSATSKLGSSTLTLTGTSGGLTHTTTFVLQIKKK
jgi:PKD repeat protein